MFLAQKLLVTKVGKTSQYFIYLLDRDCLNTGCWCGESSELLVLGQGCNQID